MTTLFALANRLPWSMVIIACLMLGVTPLGTTPHIIEKMQMLASGTLSRPIDILDLLFHGAPFLVAAMNLVAARRRPSLR